MGTLIKDDATILREMFKEMAKLRGIEVRYQYLYSNLDYSIHTELKGSYSEPIAMNIIFEEYPRQSTLKRLGWFSEDPKAERPPIAQLPYDAPYLQKGCRILIKFGPNGEEKVFRITRITCIMQYPDSWYCQLAPEFETTTLPVDTNYNQTDTNFLKETEGDM